VEFHQWVPDVECHEAAQVEVIRLGLSEELKDSLQHWEIPSDLTEFVKICSKCDSQSRARAAPRMSGRLTVGSKKHETTSNTTSAPEATPMRTVAGYFGPATMDRCTIKGSNITAEEPQHRREAGLCMYCEDSRHFAASCPRRLNAASGPVEVTPLRDSAQRKEV
jgi:hypothetical protein